MEFFLLTPVRNGFLPTGLLLILQLVRNLEKVQKFFVEKIQYFPLLINMYMLLYINLSVCIYVLI